MYGTTFTFIAARAQEYPLVWRRGQMKKPHPWARVSGVSCPDPTGRWLLLNTLETNRSLQGHAVQAA
ncbi:MAG: hypothetical protein LUO91_05050 [Methanomicrobiales archaeon]|nr:hypothetical protein [Methanomicrobiales archaeon]